jgi:hypothetical protein
VGNWQNHKDKILAALDQYDAKPGGPFSWWDDGLACEPWSYDFHVAWVEAWNREGRKTGASEFVRRFIEKALRKEGDLTSATLGEKV